MTWRICLPEQDEATWHEFEQGCDAKMAAERFAAEQCERDADCYRSFADPGMLVLVRSGGTITPVMVTVEMVPEFCSRVLR